VSERVSAGVSLHPREKTERWNLHLPKDLIATIKAKAQALGVHPSELVAEVLRQWLAEEG
jgi:predicted DNA binding CopG/RHH family protein